jgi:hypothetical protein
LQLHFEDQDMLSPITHFLPITTIRRERLLPVQGRVLVRKGQKVSASDVVAEARLAPEHIVLDIARGLGLSTKKADAVLQFQAGDEVSEGDVVAGPVGIGRRVIRAPRGGKVVIAGGGQVLVEIESPPYELKAGIPGQVTELFTDRGAEIETTGALIQGVWGNGKVDFGLLTVLIDAADGAISADQLDVSHRGAVVLGGYCGSADVINLADEIPLRGLILSSMDSSLASLAMKVNVPIVILEGFGQIPMNATAFKLLSTNERREVAVNAEGRNRLAATRPEVVIPLPASGQVSLPLEMEDFSPGQQVRVISAPKRAQTGTLVSLRPGLTVLPSGIRAQAADVRFDNGETAIFPLANLEVLA